MDPVAGGRRRQAHRAGPRTPGLRLAAASLAALALAGVGSGCEGGGASSPSGPAPASTVGERGSALGGPAGASSRGTFEAGAATSTTDGDPGDSLAPAPAPPSAAAAVAAGATALEPRGSRRSRPYASVLDRAVDARRRLAAEYRAARSAAMSAAVVERASAIATRIVADEILPAWDGTPYAASGIATRPGEQPIGCGFLVATALRDAGLRVDRTQVGQAAAEDIVLGLVPAERVSRFRRVPIGSFLARVGAGGDGIYVVGLDRHVGFLVIDGGRSYFHHASNLAGAVLRERALLSPALTTSHYRVVGKLFGAELTRAWLEETPLRARAAGDPGTEAPPVARGAPR